MKNKAWQVLVLVLFVLWVWPAGSVSAHANLDHSVPIAGAVLTQSPPEVVLDFTENVDSSFSTVQLADGHNNILVKGPGTISADKPAEMRLTLPQLPAGIYTVIWKARSAQDGHVTIGSVSFSVGNAGSLASILPPIGEASPATAPPPVFDTLIKWLAYLGAAGVAGGMLFGPIVWRSFFRKEEGYSSDQDGLVQRILTQQVRISAGGLALVTLIQLLAGPVELGLSSFFPSLIKFATGPTGLLLLVRLVLLAVLLDWNMRIPLPGSGAVWRWWVGAGFGAAILLTFSLDSHAAASGSVLSVGADWLHLVAISAWIGGLVPLGRLLHRETVFSRLVPYFSRTALGSVDLIAITGFYAMLRTADSLPALVDTLYGVALLVKIGLFFVLVAFGAVNLFFLSPRLNLAQVRAANWLKRNIRGELVLALVVLGAAGILTSVTPGTQALQAQARIGIVKTAHPGGVGMTFIISPGVVGDDEIGVDLSGLHGDQAGSKVDLRFTLLDHDMGTTQVSMTLAGASEGADPAGTVRYTARGSYLSMAGTWQVQVILRRSGQNDITQTFIFPLGVNAAQIPATANPIPADQTSIDSGQAIYAQKCVACHGPKGLGDGPIGRTLNPPPANLSMHAMPGVHSDADLFGWITHGYPGSAMPAFDRTLTDKQRWDLVNFIRTLAK